MYDLIAFDADDTLWENNSLYIEAQGKFKQILAPYGVGDTLDALFDRVEIGNLSYFGYGVMSFTLSLIEAAIEATSGRVAAADIGKIIALAKGMISSEVQLFEDAEPTLRALSSRYRLILVTKGDLLHQQSKVAQSGLGAYFSEVHVVADKTPGAYAEILKRHGVAAERFLMVGNSLRSDILPVLELGGGGVYVPYAMTWAHEMSELPPAGGYDGRFFEVDRLALLPELLEKIEKGVR
jgi:putative hydrolase of the HAD superfamily